jgi:hypothetical protein
MAISGPEPSDPMVAVRGQDGSISRTIDKPPRAPRLSVARFFRYALHEGGEGNAWGRRGAGSAIFSWRAG